jgi:hypothetical protein
MAKLGTVLAAAVAAATGVCVLPPGAGAVPAPATVSVGYTCSAALGTLAVTVHVTGTTPATAKQDAAVSMTGAQVGVTIPAADVNKVISLTHAKSASGKATKLDLVATDADVATVNAAARPIAFGPVALVQNKPATLRLPATPAIVGHWTAADKAGAVMSFSAGTIVISLTVGPYSGSATCKPAKAVAVSTTKIA